MRPEILLHPNIPQPLQGMSPRVILGEEWWDTKRKEAYKKHNYHCWACGVHKSDAKYKQWLEGHECYVFNYEKGTAFMVEVVALCYMCHAFIHSGLTQVWFNNNKINKKEYGDIIKHGENLLKTVDYKKLNPYIIDSYCKVADWADWKIIVDGKVYPTKFKNISEWKEHYSA